MDKNSSTVSITVLHIEPATGGPLVALASVELIIDGVALVLQGLRIVRRPPNIGVEAPLFRNGTKWLPAILFPDDLAQPLADAVLNAYDGEARRVCADKAIAAQNRALGRE